MPIVFAHGVSNRPGQEYDRRVAQRTEFLRALVLPALGLDPARVEFYDPCWGREGIVFRWHNASLPDPSREYETFGATHDQTELALVAHLPGLARYEKGDIVSIAKRSLLDAVEILWTTAMAGAKSKEIDAALAQTYALVAGYAEHAESPAWVPRTLPANFAEQLLTEAKIWAAGTSVAMASHSAYESFGFSEFLEELGEAASRVGNVLADLSGDVATSLGRHWAHLAASVFVGDVFKYLMCRGDKNQPGPIPSIVLEALRTANAARSAADPKLILIGHSLGGVISYDLLTHFAPNLSVDAFVTVGSQVGLFEEMTLFKESRDTTPPHPPQDRVKTPANVKMWLNIFDTSDVFGFRVDGVFDGARDFSYDTGYGLFNAHGGYFERPSFYRRLAVRLKELTA